MRGEILVLDDDPAMRHMLEGGLQRRDFAVQSRGSADAGLELLRERDFDVVVTDLNMRGMGGIELCERLRASRPDVPVVVITAFGSLDSAVQAIRAGAYDFLNKPFELEALALVLDRAGGHRRLDAEVKQLRERIDQLSPSAEMLGDSAPMRAVCERIARLGPMDSSVLITGETGTGKELVARALHQRSPRRQGPFVAVNCAAIPAALMESELFGHRRGAFTDARSDRSGLFQQASGGTLFLDEVGDLDLQLQPTLLRVLQERVIRPVGGDREVSVDVRVLAATHRDLATAADEGRFRQDLLYRLDVVRIELPPLRARGSDVLLLAQAFVTTAAARMRRGVTGFMPDAAQKLLAYPWPGNVRELANAVESAVATTRYEQFTAVDLPAKIQDHAARHVLVAGTDPGDLVSLEEVERRYILRVLEAAGGNQTMAARILGLDRKTLYRKLQHYRGE